MLILSPTQTMTDKEGLSGEKDKSQSPTNSNRESKMEDGRYLYCLVELEDTDTDSWSLSLTGIEDNPVKVVSVKDIGAVVHNPEDTYDTSNMEKIKRWILTHQKVVDAVADTFGTPLPMRFGTVLKGGDEGVKDWLDNSYRTVRDELSKLAGKWEYRITLLWKEEKFEQKLAEKDDSIQDLDRRQEDSNAGKSFLLSKKRRQRLRDLKRERRREIIRDLKDTVDPVIEDITQLQNNTSIQESTDKNSGSEDESDYTKIARIAVTTMEDRESDLGSKLDEVVEKDGVKIEFTGPWPPYTFASDME